MKTVRLNISDGFYDQIISFLDLLPRNVVSIDVEKEIIDDLRILKAASFKTKGFKFNREEANAR